MTPQEQEALSIPCPACRAGANIACRDFASGTLGRVAVRPHYARLQAVAAIAKAGGGNG